MGRRGDHRLRERHLGLLTGIRYIRLKRRLPLDRGSLICYLDLRLVRKLNDGGSLNGPEMREFMPKYNTKQRALLMDFLTARADQEFTAREIAEALKPQGISISAVYRNLADLEEDGLLTRRTRQKSRENQYRYVGGSSCAEALHLSCKVCGKTIHMSGQETEFFVKTIAANDRFFLDRHETVLYGTCRNCRKKTGEDER